MLHLDWDGSAEAIDVETFRQKLLAPIWRAIAERNLEQQIDYLVYSCDLPTRIDFDGDAPPEIRDKLKFPSGSLTGMSYLYEVVMARQVLQYATLTPSTLEVNHYYRTSDDETPTHGFRNWYGWGPNGRLLESGGVHYRLSTMLLATGAKGNTTAEALEYLHRSAAADGTRPKGTVYYMRNSDIRSKTREPAFAGAIESLAKLGVRAEVDDGNTPTDKHDVVGLMMGIAPLFLARFQEHDFARRDLREFHQLRRRVRSGEWADAPFRVDALRGGRFERHGDRAVRHRGQISRPRDSGALRARLLAGRVVLSSAALPGAASGGRRSALPPLGPDSEG